MESSARARWFAFELVPVHATFRGDWAAFVKHKEAEERAFDAEARAATGSSRHGPPPSVEQARARRVLQQEFTELASARVLEIRTRAKAILEALQRGDVEALVDDCVMYSASAPERRALTRAFLGQHRDELMAMAKLADVSGPLMTGDLHFTAPSPHTGMPARVTLAFGPKGTAPKEGEYFPERHELELWWSGEVMPDANGPLHATPAANPPPSRWHFYRLAAPYSMRRTYLQ